MNDKKKIFTYDNFLNVLTALVLIIAFCVLILIITFITSATTRKSELIHMDDSYKIVYMECESYKNTSDRYITLEDNIGKRTSIKVDKETYYKYIIGDTVYIDEKNYTSLFHMADETLYVICECDKE